MQKDINTVFSVTTGYDRTGDVDLITGYECDRCHESKICLGFDSSAGEYGWIKLCRSCVDSLFDQTG